MESTLPMKLFLVSGMDFEHWFLLMEKLTENLISLLSYMLIFFLGLLEANNTL